MGSYPYMINIYYSTTRSSVVVCILASTCLFYSNG